MTSADASFLLRLYIPRSGSAKAAEIMEAQSEPIIVTSLLVFELENAIRHSAWLRRQDRTKGISVEFATSALAALQSDLEWGRLRSEPCDLDALVRKACDISHRRTWSDGCRTMDTIHIAGALLLNANRFLTFDIVQKNVADAEGLCVDW
ncbi:MAG TPA: type II toxin-antitoxin system VapC family toxin [Chthoniobacteraceae bacterium]|jgi:predicted nucleic acid-binding protein|nr:type II toxin-antitoxin system VapC family toxin [Chthoniobacteraceae bacterium]